MFYLPTKCTVSVFTMKQPKGTIPVYICSLKWCLYRHFSFFAHHSWVFVVFQKPNCPHWCHHLCRGFKGSELNSFQISSSPWCTPALAPRFSYLDFIYYRRAAWKRGEEERETGEALGLEGQQNNSNNMQNGDRRWVHLYSLMVCSLHACMCVCVEYSNMLLRPKTHSNVWLPLYTLSLYSREWRIS